MSSFIYFFQRTGALTCLGHLGIGVLATCIVTIVGIAADKLQILSGYPARICFWQSYLLLSLVGSGFVDRYENGSPVYAGLPFMIVWLIGVLSGIPIYTFVSMLIHYRRSTNADRRSSP